MSKRGRFSLWWMLFTPCPMRCIKCTKTSAQDTQACAHAWVTSTAKNCLTTSGPLTSAVSVKCHVIHHFRRHLENFLMIHSVIRWTFMFEKFKNIPPKVWWNMAVWKRLKPNAAESIQCDWNINWIMIFFFLHYSTFLVPREMMWCDHLCKPSTWKE